MPIALLPSFIFYSFISGITPGPANLASMSAAMRYGRKRAFKQWLGLFVGYAVVSFAAGAITYFIGQAFNDYIWILSVVGFCYIMWLAIHILLSKSADENEAKDCNFLSGLLVQITNVKIMIFCFSVFGTYVLPYSTELGSVLTVAAILPFIGPAANLAWLVAGGLLKKEYERRRKLWNVIMAVSLMLCAVSIIFVR